MKTLWTLLMAAALLVALSGSAVAMPTLYTNEADYLNDLSATGAAIISESFESSVWDAARYPTTVSSITSQSFTWTAGEGVTTGTGWARTGTYGVFDSWGDPDNLFTVSSLGIQIGFAGWFDNSTATSIDFLLDQSLVGTLNFSSASHEFFGVIDLAGFNQVAMSAPDEHWGADDFTFGVTSRVIPEPTTLMLVGLGLCGLGARLRRKSS